MYHLRAKLALKTNAPFSVLELLINAGFAYLPQDYTYLQDARGASNIQAFLSDAKDYLSHVSVQPQKNNFQPQKNRPFKINLSKINQPMNFIKINCKQ
jgi:hypothetical protein